MLLCDQKEVSTESSPLLTGKMTAAKSRECRSNLRYSGARKDERENFMLNGITDGPMLLALTLRDRYYFSMFLEKNVNLGN